MFQHKLLQSTTNTFNYHGNGITVNRNVCSDPDINHIYSSDIKRKVFLQTKKVTVLLGSSGSAARKKYKKKREK